MRESVALYVIAASVLWNAAAPLSAKPIQHGEAPVVLDDALLIGRVGRHGRVPLHIDPIEQQVVTGTWRPPLAGDTVESPVGDLDQRGRER